jgi:hypothetical protein
MNAPRTARTARSPQDVLRQTITRSGASDDDGETWTPYGSTLSVTETRRWLLSAGLGTTTGDFGILVRVAFEVTGLDAAAITTISMIGK